MMNRAYAAYKNTAAQTASPERLLIMLYDGLIHSLEAAKSAIELKDLTTAHSQLIKAQTIVLEGLLGPLDMSYEVSQQLSDMYNYFHRRLMQANVEKSVEPIVEVLSHVRQFRETWIQAAVKAKSSVEDNPAPVTGNL